MRALTLLILLTLVHLPLLAADPPDIQRIEDARDKAIENAQAQFDAAVTKANAAAVKAMDVVVKAHTKDGDLDGAVKAKSYIDQWKPPAPAQAQGADTNAPTPVYVGVWQLNQNGGFLTNLTVNTDGTASWGSTAGTWTKDGSVLKFSWGNAIDIPASNNCKVIDHGRNGAVYTISISK